MLHLIIEACISRKLIDTSAYLWPGYVVSSGSLKDTTLPQESPWLNFMKGARLSGPLIDALVATPASRFVNWPVMTSLFLSFKLIISTLVCYITSFVLVQHS